MQAEILALNSAVATRARHHGITTNIFILASSCQYHAPVVWRYFFHSLQRQITSGSWCLVWFTRVKVNCYNTVKRLKTPLRGQAQWSRPDQTSRIDRRETTVNFVQNDAVPISLVQDVCQHRLSSSALFAGQTATVVTKRHLWIYHINETSTDFCALIGFKMLMNSQFFL